MAANRTKTIEYALPMMTGDIAASATHTDSADITVYIPETTSRAFKSVVLEVTACENYGTSGNDLTAWSLRGSCDSGSNDNAGSQLLNRLDKFDCWYIQES